MEKYGRPDMSYFKFLNDIKRNKKIYLNGNGNIKRSFTHIDDAIIAITKIISKYKNLKSFNEIYNIGNNKSVKISNIINIIKKIIRKNLKLLSKKEFNVDSQITKSSNLKIYDSIKFEPKVDIDKGLKEFITWFEKILIYFLNLRVEINSPYKKTVLLIRSNIGNFNKLLFFDYYILIN